jgi:hypothetical protein
MTGCSETGERPVQDRNEGEEAYSRDLLSGMLLSRPVQLKILSSSLADGSLSGLDREIPGHV